MVIHHRFDWALVLVNCEFFLSSLL